MKENWTYKKLGEVCTIKGRIGFRGYTREDLVAPGEGAITLSPSNIVDDKIDYSKCSYISWFKYNESPEIMVYNGDIVYAKTASIGKVALITELPEKATINPQFVVLKEIACNNRFLYYILRSSSFRLQANSIVRGVAIPTISQANLAETTIPVPPLAEQERIVEELDLLSGIIEKQKQQLKELDTLAQSIFYDTFGDPITNEKNWPLKKLGEVAQSDLGKTLNSSKDTGSLKPYLCAINIKWNFIDLANLKEAKFNESDLRNYSVKKGDLLVCEGGDIGRAAIWKEDYSMLYQNALHRIRFNKSIIPVYCMYFLLELKCQGVLDAKYGKGVTIKHLVKSSLYSILIPIPPLSLQQEFAEKIEMIEKQKEAIGKSIKETQLLFDYTMDKYFG